MNQKAFAGHGRRWALIAALVLFTTGDARADKLPTDVKQLPTPNFVPAPTKKMISSAAIRKAKRDYRTGLGHLRFKRYPRAIAAFKAALANNPNSQLARYKLAAALVAAGKRVEGLALLHQLEKLKCKACPSRGDEHFSSVWMSVIYNLIVMNHDIDRYQKHAWWVKPGGCPAGTARRGDKFEDETAHGRAYCVRGRVKQGPYAMVTNNGPGMGHTYQIRGSYRHGKREGLWHVGTTYMTYDLGSYRNGKRHGVWVTVGAGTRIGSMGVYRNGKKEGRHASSDGYGFRSVAHYRRGVRHGEFSYWNKGKLIAKTTLNNNSGMWIKYRAGTLIEKGRLVRGRKVGLWRVGDDTGKYRNGVRHGTWREKYDTGNYRNGVRHGAWVYRSDKTTVRARGSYRFGRAHGKWLIKGDSNPRDDQELVFRNGRLTKIDGERASKADRTLYRRLVEVKWWPGKISKDNAPPDHM